MSARKTFTKEDLEKRREAVKVAANALVTGKRWRFADLCSFSKKRFSVSNPELI